MVMPIHCTVCPNCENEVDVDVEPYIQAQTYGDPDSCYPAEGGTIDPSKCPECRAKLDTIGIYEEWAEARQDFSAIEE